jgi:hypothetical protein
MREPCQISRLLSYTFFGNGTHPFCQATLEGPGTRESEVEFDWTPRGGPRSTGYGISTEIHVAEIPFHLCYNTSFWLVLARREQGGSKLICIFSLGHQGRLTGVRSGRLARRTPLPQSRSVLATGGHHDSLRVVRFGRIVPGTQLS